MDRSNDPVLQKRPLWVWLLPVLAVAGFLGYVIPKEVAWVNDANSYIGAAASIAKGYGYRYEPYIDLPEAGVYPPLFSAWLALFWHLGGDFPENSAGLITANAIVAVAGLVPLTLFLRRVGVPFWFTTLSILLFGTSVVLLTLTAHLFSDVLFASLTFALAWWVVSPRADPLRPSLIWWAGIGLLCALLILTRSAGIGIVAGIVSIWAFNPRHRKLRVAGCLLGPILVGFIIKKWLSPTESGYGNYMTIRFVELGGWTGYLHQMRHNALDYLSGRCWVEALFNVPDRSPLARGIIGTSWETVFRIISAAMGLTLHGVAAFGIWTRRNEGLTRAALWVSMAYVGVLVIWPFPLGTRALLPCLPFLLMWVWTGLSKMPLTPKTLRFAAMCLAGFCILQVAGNSELSRRYAQSMNHTARDESHAILAAADWLNSNAPVDALIAAGREEPVMHIRESLGRRLLANPTSTPIPHLFYDVSPRSQKDRQAKFVVARKEPDPVPGYTFKRVQTFPPFGIYEISGTD